MARRKARLAQETPNRIAVLGNLAVIDPVVDINKAMRQIRAQPFDLIVELLIEVFQLTMRRNDCALVQQLLWHLAPPLMPPGAHSKSAEIIRHTKHSQHHDR